MLAVGADRARRLFENGEHFAILEDADFFAIERRRAAKIYGSGGHNGKGFFDLLRLIGADFFIEGDLGTLFEDQKIFADRLFALVDEPFDGHLRFVTRRAERRIFDFIPEYFFGLFLIGHTRRKDLGLVADRQCADGFAAERRRILNRDRTPDRITDGNRLIADLGDAARRVLFLTGYGGRVRLSQQRAP